MGFFGERDILFSHSHCSVHHLAPSTDKVTPGSAVVAGGRQQAVHFANEDCKMHQKGIVCGKRVRSEPAGEEGAAMLRMAGVLLLGSSSCRSKKGPPLLFVLLMMMLLQCTASVAASAVGFQKAETLTGDTTSVMAVSFSHDSSLLASGLGGSTVIITDTVTWKPVATLTDHSYSVWAVSFSHDSSLLASGSVNKSP
eukprot:gene19288-3785_t